MGLPHSCISLRAFWQLLLFALLLLCLPLRSAAEVVDAQGWKVEVIASQLEHPWSIAFIETGKALITERPGRLRLLENWELRQEPIEGVPPVFAHGQGGLLDVILAGDFAESRRIYLTYAAGDEASNQTTLASASYHNGALHDLRVLFEAKPKKSGGQHFGSRLLWLPDGTLLMTIGDGGNPPLAVEGKLAREHAQLMTSHLGKILRFDEHGQVPSNNPFVAAGGVLDEVYSLGHRNIQGLAYDSVRDVVWASEHGPLGGDELNLIEAGANFGWPLVTEGRDYRTGEPIGVAQPPESLIPPLHVWTPALAPSGLVVYSGRRFTSIRGDIFAGGLRAQEIRQLTLSKSRKVAKEQRIRIGARVRDVREGPDGFLYVLTDERNGRLLRLGQDDQSEATE